MSETAAPLSESDRRAMLDRTLVGMLSWLDAQEAAGVPPMLSLGILQGALMNALSAPQTGTAAGAA